MRCTGHCCERIGLKFSPEELKNAYRETMMLKGEGASVSMSSDNYSGIRKNKIWSDVWLIYPMLIFLGTSKFHPERPWEEQGEDSYIYSCKHYDSKNKKCTIYEDRPMMCRSYPDNGFCGNPKCTSSEAKKRRPKIIQDIIKAWNTGGKKSVDKLLESRREKNEQKVYHDDFED